VSKRSTPPAYRGGCRERTSLNDLLEFGHNPGHNPYAEGPTVAPGRTCGRETVSKTVTNAGAATHDSSSIDRIISCVQPVPQLSEKLDSYNDLQVVI
jgi:hypothetical protein